MKLAIERATDEQPSLVTKLGCGGVAGIIGQTLTYPLDVVRRQMQVKKCARFRIINESGLLDIPG